MHRRVMLAGMAAQLMGLWPGPLVAQTTRPAASILRQASASVVKVDADGLGATGFLWPDAQHVVTALHLVDNRQRLSIHYVDEGGRIAASSAAVVERVLKAADLVLLRLERPQPRPSLQHSNRAAVLKQSLDALGFPLGIGVASSTEVRVRFGGQTLRTILPPKVARQISEYPDLGLEVLNLEGNLVPGHSGAPLLDAEGMVAGIGDGGLEEGAVGICWGIPATQLRLLAASTVTQTPRAPRVAQLFSADLEADIRPVSGQRGDGLVKVRTRTYEQLRSTADDALGLAQLTQLFAPFQPDRFRYDIYQHLATGATVVIPQGVVLRQEREFVIATMPEQNLEMRLLVRAVENEPAAYAQAQQFEQLLAKFGDPSFFTQVDPAWSYLTPVRRGSLLVNRRAAGIFRMWNGVSLPQSYLFEALATNGRGFLGVAAINGDTTQPTLMLEAQCAQGFVDPRCPAVIERRRRWAQMVLAVQFSSFPTSLG